MSLKEKKTKDRRFIIAVLIVVGLMYMVGCIYLILLDGKWQELPEENLSQTAVNTTLACMFDCEARNREFSAHNEEHPEFCLCWLNKSWVVEDVWKNES